jgi:hypothetical protein
MQLPSDSEGSAASEALHNKLKEYRFQRTESRSSTRSSSAGTSFSPIDQAVPVTIPTKKQRGAVGAIDLAEADLKRISTCVGCHAKWTTRKTPKEKMKHMRVCLKKNGLTDATVQYVHSVVASQLLSAGASFLVQQAMSPTADASNKGKGKAISADPGLTDPKTYLEEIAGDHGSKRRGKRKEVQTTVRLPTDVGVSIAQRAAALLGTGPNTHTSSKPNQLSANPDTCSPATQAFRAIAPGQQNLQRVNLSQQIPAATQPMGTSNLAGRYRNEVGGTRLWESGAVEDGADEVPPATQELGHSKIGGLYYHTRGTTSISLGHDDRHPAVVSSEARNLGCKPTAFVDLVNAPLTPSPAEKTVCYILAGSPDLCRC